MAHDSRYILSGFSILVTEIKPKMTLTGWETNRGVVCDQSFRCKSRHYFYFHEINVKLLLSYFLIRILWFISFELFKITQHLLIFRPSSTSLSLSYIRHLSWHQQSHSFIENTGNTSTYCIIFFSRNLFTKSLVFFISFKLISCLIIIIPIV
jgi:hypothetical protein